MRIHPGRVTTGWRTALLIAASGAASAAAQSLGPEIQVQSDATEYQQRPDVAADGSGRFIAVWDSFPDGPNDVFARRFDSAGNPLGDDSEVNTYEEGYQQNPEVAADGGGGFVVVWESSGQDGGASGIFGQRFDSAGDPAGDEFQVNTFTAGPQADPGVAADAGGNFVVVWESEGQDGSSRGVFGQRFDSSGDRLGTEFQVNTYTTGNQQDPAVAVDDSGAFVVVWTGSGEQDGWQAGVFAQRFDAEGEKLGDELQVNTSWKWDQFNPSVATDGSGSFVVVWQDFQQDLSGNDVFAQRFDASGEPVGDEIDVNTYTSGRQADADVAVDRQGNITVVWNGGDDQDGSDSGIFWQRYDAEGNPLGGELQVNVYTSDTQHDPAVATTGSGNLFVVWTSTCFDDPCTFQDGSGGGIFGRLTTSPGSSGVFSDDFESGGVCAWTGQSGSADSCP